MTSSKDKVTFLYAQRLSGGGYERGIIECKIEADGSLAGCKNVGVNFDEAD